MTSLTAGDHDSTEPDILTLAEAASLLRISLSTAKKLARSGELPASKVGGQWRLSRHRLLELVVTNSDYSASPRVAASHSESANA